MGQLESFQTDHECDRTGVSMANRRLISGDPMHRDLWAVLYPLSPSELRGAFESVSCVDLVLVSCLGTPTRQRGGRAPAGIPQQLLRGAR